ncbi:hypothetical protein ACOMHN_046587 [Nucella lapillus]
MWMTSVPSLQHVDDEVVSQDPVKLIEQTYALISQGLNLPSATQGSQSHFEVLLRCYPLLLREAARQGHTVVSCTSVFV